MSHVSFTTAEFVRMQTQVENLLKMNASLKRELDKWEPSISIEADASSGAPMVRYTAKLGNAGFSETFTPAVLAGAQPEVLRDIADQLSKRTALLAAGRIANMIGPHVQKAADYSHTVQGK